MTNSIKAHYDKIAWQYCGFYSNDLYSVRENQAIADLIKMAIPKSFFRQRRLRVSDLGCGAGLPRVIWDTLLPRKACYEGYDLSPAMLQVAYAVYAQEIQRGIARFFEADVTKIIKTLPDNYYDLIFLLHGVLSYWPCSILPEILSQLSRTLHGYAVLSFFSRYSCNRAAVEYPKKFLHQDRQLDCEPIWMNTYTSREIYKLLNNSNLKIISMIGMNLSGGLSSVHADFTARQGKIVKRKAQGSNVDKEMQALEHDIAQTIAHDMKLGALVPDAGHDIIVVVKKK